MIQVSHGHQGWVLGGDHVCHIVTEKTALLCHLGLGELLSPVAGRGRLWQGNGADR